VGANVEIARTVLGSDAEQKLLIRKIQEGRLSFIV
jgi:hypothetical protein